jgi:hypothetical protein
VEKIDVVPREPSGCVGSQEESRNFEAIYMRAAGGLGGAVDPIFTI